MDSHFVWKLCIALGALQQFSIAAPNDYDFLLFSQQWPATTCAKSGRQLNQCNIPQNDGWTIHGIWPSKSGQWGPENCQNIALNVQNLQPIRNQLQARWLNVLSANPEGFWRHEWKTHGTCSLDLPDLNTQFKYFNKGLQLNNNYVIGTILRNGGITPGRSYSLQNIVGALNRGLNNATPHVNCFKDRAGRQFLHEVRICLSKSFQLINCAGHVPATNCNPRNNIEFPSR